VGLLIAFDFPTRPERDAYVQAMREQRAIVLRTEERTVRWRPNLALSASEAQEALAKNAAAIEACTVEVR